MSDLFTTTVLALNLKAEGEAASMGHPWLAADTLELSALPEATTGSATITTTDGQCLGSGILDPRDPVAAWRRFSWEPNVEFDAHYIADAVQAALERRSDDACQRLIDSDADYLPGLIVEIYENVLSLRIENAAVEAHQDVLIEIFQEMIAPREIVLDRRSPYRTAFGLKTGLATASGQNLKGFWVDVDELSYRLDLLNPTKPALSLDLREQYSLVGSLCTERRILECYTSQAAFSLQAMRHGAAEAVALSDCSDAVKAIGANAQKNQLSVEAVETPILTYLQKIEFGAFECIVIDFPETIASAEMQAVLEQAFSCLAPGGVFAAYTRDAGIERDDFEARIARAAARSGREGRVFACISQPFDFPVLLNLPESARLKGLILQVE